MTRPTLNVVDAVAGLLATLRSSGSSAQSLADAEHDLRAALTSCTEAELLDTALELDPDDELPIQLKSGMFERRLSLGPRTPALLRRYAQHLWLHGPERDAEVRALRAEADAADA
jgi:hypothetical protein